MSRLSASRTSAGNGVGPGVRRFISGLLSRLRCTARDRSAAARWTVATIPTACYDRQSVVRSTPSGQWPARRRGASYSNRCESQRQGRRAGSGSAGGRSAFIAADSLARKSSSSARERGGGSGSPRLMRIRRPRHSSRVSLTPTGTTGLSPSLARNATPRRSRRTRLSGESVGAAGSGKMQTAAPPRNCRTASRIPCPTSPCSGSERT